MTGKQWTPRNGDYIAYRNRGDASDRPTVIMCGCVMAMEGECYIVLPAGYAFVDVDPYGMKVVKSSVPNPMSHVDDGDRFCVRPKDYIGHWGEERIKLERWAVRQ